MGRWLPLLGVSLAILPGCKRLKTGAQEHFSTQYSCPAEGVTVQARDDLRYGDLLLARQASESPSAEVSADPERLAKWTQDQRDRQDELRHNLNGLDMFEVRGCDHRVLFGCGHPGNGHGGPDTLSVNCWEIPTDPPAHPPDAHP